MLKTIASLVCTAALACSPVAAQRQHARLVLSVANYLESTVTVYPLGAYGDSRPIRTIGGPKTGLHHPFGLCEDVRGDVYVVSSAYPVSITEFAAGAHGNVSPLRTIAGPHTGLFQPQWIALDAAGDIFVSDVGAPGRPNGSVRVFAKTAAGDVAPFRVLSGPRTKLLNPEGLFVRPDGLLVVLSDDPARAGNDAVLVFSRGASGDVAPLRRLGGTDSGLVQPLALARVPGSPDAWVSNFGNASVTKYTPPKGDDLDPLVALAGSRTGFGSNSPSGIVVDPFGNLYVANRFANPNLDKIEVFASNARGNTPPQLTLSGPHTGLFGPSGIAIGPD